MTIECIPHKSKVPKVNDAMHPLKAERPVSDEAVAKKSVRLLW